MASSHFTYYRGSAPIEDVKPALHKGVFGVSRTPIYYPLKSYEKRVGEKPKVCPVCQFEVTSPEQMELHHPTDKDVGTSKRRTKEYYRTPVEPICANCHSLEHRTGEHLQANCGLWHRESIPCNVKYRDPSLIFTPNCKDTYRLQKTYFIKWHLRSAQDYKCSDCGVIRWGPDNKMLSLELHHIDGKHSNSTTDNIQLLCPNCHRAKRKPTSEP